MPQTRTGILTQTILASPTIKWILDVRIRQKSINDVVFVGDRFIHVKQVKEGGHLHHVATKDDFDANIRAAKVFDISNEQQSSGDDIIVKKEGPSEDDLPPQLVVLTLDTNDLVFLYLSTANGELRFVHQGIPMPIYSRTLWQPGQHLAVEPFSRALAVAANENEVVIYSAKARDHIKRQLQTADTNWCPISAERPLRVEGVIQLVDFLIPPSDDADLVILLLIVVDRGRTKAVRIEWQYPQDIHSAHIYPAEILGTARSIPGLLVPLRNANFLLVNGEEGVIWMNILSGSLTMQLMDHVVGEPKPPLYPGCSPRHPQWASWCRPRRNPSVQAEHDYFYLAREDGRIFWLGAKHRPGDRTVRLDIADAGELDCSVGTAFASLGDSHDPDILAAAGDMSSGRVVSIGHFPSTSKLVEYVTRIDIMTPNLIELIPNWASVTDMTISNLPQANSRSARSRDGIFVTSGRQPYGAVTELRKGIEARLMLYLEIEGLKLASDVFILPERSDGSLLFLFSGPAGTRLLHAGSNLSESTEIEEVGSERTAFDLERRTLLAISTNTAQLLQVTTRSLCLTAGMVRNFDDTSTVECAEGSRIVLAAYEPFTGVVMVVSRTEASLEPFRIVILRDTTGNEDALRQQIEDFQSVPGTTIESEPLSLAATHIDDTLMVVVAELDGTLELFTSNGPELVKSLTRHKMICTGDAPAIADSICILQLNGEGQDCEVTQLVLCGLRDGRLYAVTLGMHGFEDSYVFDYCSTTVKLQSLKGDPNMLYAMGGQDTCRITWEGKSAKNLVVDSVCITDKERPELLQGAVAGCGRMPPADVLESPELAGLTVMISGDELLIVNLDDMPSTVPREISVSGTPNRLHYAEQQRCLVCASLTTDVRSFPSSKPQSPPEERRQIWPTIDFIPSRSTTSSHTFSFQPGERVYSLLDWSHARNNDKVYSFVMVGGTRLSKSGTSRGKITFLQASFDKWDIIDVKEGREVRLESPVYAMALYDEISFVACSGNFVHLYRIDTETMKWEQPCEPFWIASAGIQVTVEDKLIYIATLKDSLVVLEYASSSAGADHDTELRSKLKAVCTAPMAADLLSHLSLDIPSTTAATTKEKMVLLSTKHAELIALQSPGLNGSQPLSTGAAVPATAHLPASCTRLKKGNIKPPWKKPPPSGVLEDGILGSTADGRLIGISFIDESLWRKLWWLQGLVERSERLSPHVWQDPAYSAEGASTSHQRALPIGLSGGQAEISLETLWRPEDDMHIDGDILRRVLTHGGLETLRSVIRESAKSDDRIGEWLRARLDQELDAAEDMIAVLRVLLESWL